jgi:hypothetical protein
MGVAETFDGKDCCSGSGWNDVAFQEIWFACDCIHAVSEDWVWSVSPILDGVQATVDGNCSVMCCGRAVEMHVYVAAILVNGVLVGDEKL